MDIVHHPVKSGAGIMKFNITEAMAEKVKLLKTFFALLLIVIVLSF